jgi:hypothetical protein
MKERESKTKYIRDVIYLKDTIKRFQEVVKGGNLFIKNDIAIFCLQMHQVLKYGFMPPLKDFLEGVYALLKLVFDNKIKWSGKQGDSECSLILDALKHLDGTVACEAFIHCTLTDPIQSHYCKFLISKMRQHKKEIEEIKRKIK